MSTIEDQCDRQLQTMPRHLISLLRGCVWVTSEKERHRELTVSSSHAARLFGVPQ